MADADSSRVLQPYRAVGLVTGDVPFALTTLGTKTFITVSIGKAFQVYDSDKLTLAMVAPPGNRAIRAIETYRTTTFAAVGRDILSYKRGRPLYKFQGHEFPIRLLSRIGSVLLSVSEGGQLRAWNLHTGESLRSVALPREFHPTVALHPVTYLNKILLGGAEGTLQLWNVRSGRMVFEFSRWAGTAVTALAQSTAVDVVGIGFADGRIVVHNLRTDETVMSFQQADGAVTSLSFRSDPPAASTKGAPASTDLLASASPTGQVHLWELNEHRIFHTLPDAHDGRVTRVAFLPRQPLLVTAGADNAVKVWLFDAFDGTPRLLRGRQGHKEPPTHIRYHGGHTLASTATGADGTACQILSASSDRTFRMFHTGREQQSGELSQGSLVKRARAHKVSVDSLRLPPVVAFDAAETRERDWASAVTCHANDPSVYTWRLDRRTVGRHVLRPDNPRRGRRKRRNGKRDVSDAVADTEPPATSCAISLCGSFALVGDASGRVFAYNLQSGQARGAFPAVQDGGEDPMRVMRQGTALPLRHRLRADREKAAEAGAGEGPGNAHEGPVTGLAVDGLNKTLVSASLDGTVRFWDMQSRAALGEAQLGSPAAQMEMHRDSGLAAVACDDLIVRVVDVASRRIVRRFRGHGNRITDLAFSRDGRWLVSTAADGTLRVWDVPGARCLDWVKFQHAPTSAAWSPTGEFLATSHVGSVGIFLWANRACFTDVLSDVEPTAARRLLLPEPAVAGEGARESKDGAADGDGASSRRRRPVMDQAVSAPGGLEMDSDEGEGEGGEEGARALVEAGRELDRGRDAAHTAFAGGESDTDSDAEAGAAGGPWQSDSDEDSDGDEEEEEEEGAEEKALAPTGGDPEHSDLPAPLAEGAATLSEAPRSKWATLAKLDLVRARNRPKKPAQKPSSIPFFLTAAGASVGEGADARPGEPAGGDDDGGSRLFKGSLMELHRTALMQHLDAAEAAGSDDERTASWAAASAHVDALSAPDCEVAFRELSQGAHDERGLRYLTLALAWLEHRLRLRQAFQVVQAQIALFLTLHGDQLAREKSCAPLLERLQHVQRESWEHLHALLQGNMSLVQLFSGL